MPEVPHRLAEALKDRYTLQRELGRGGMATVYLAEDLKHHRLVALKVLKPELAAVLGSERFLREIELSAGLTHPHILPLHDSGHAGGFLYHVMPYVEGESLRDWLNREKQLPLDDALRVAREVADALSYAHSRGVIHRDIKPENILLQAGHAVVADFGIARAIEYAGGANLTETGVALGTPAYMSPEQAAGQSRIDGRADIYALGCVLYEMLAGAPPFSGPSPLAILARHTLDPVPPLQTVRKAVPDSVEHVVLRALEKVAADRFATAADFGDALGLGLPPVRSPRRVAVLTAAAAGAALVVVLVWWALVGREADAAPIDRLAVLPLTNLMGDSAQDYLVDGLHDLLITELAKVLAVTVISRSSVLGYRNAPKSTPAIARDLKVDAVVEGSVLRTGDTLHMTVQLIDGRTDRHLWAETYSRSWRETLAVPSQAARAIAQRLGSRAGAAALVRLPPARAVDPRAADLYLKGRHFCHQWTSDGFRQGIQFLRQAVDVDPTFARAYAILGECYSQLPLFTLAAPREAFSNAKAAVEQALTLDSTLAEAYVTRALVTMWFEWDLRGPEADFARALQLSPNRMEVHFYRSLWLAYRRQFDESVREVRRAIEIDPLSVTTSLQLGWTYFNARRYDESIAQLERTLEMAPDFGFTHMELAWNYTMKGVHAEAARACDRAVTLRDPEDQVLPANCAWVYGRAGRLAEARRLLEIVLEIGKRRWLDPFNIVIVYEALGDRDEAFRWLDRAITERSAAIPFLPVEPALDGLRSDPRFAAAMRRAGLEP